MTVEIVHADAVQWAREYRGPLMHALLCDPPYHLTSGNVSVDWSSFKTDKGTTNNGGRGHRGGFMGKKWDGGDIAFRPDTWAAFANVLHPGAFGMAFASSRGWHRLAVAIEDAGLIIHPSIFGWGFGSGFPKATRVNYSQDNEWLAAFVDIPGEVFNGHRYGLQALKPALEPVIVFQKPYEGRAVDSITATGAGAMWIDGGRIPANGESLSGGMINGTSKAGEGWDRPWRHDPEAIERNKAIHAERIAHAEAAGRWPANLIITSAEAAAALDAQSGDTRVVDESVYLHYNRSEVNTCCVNASSVDVSSMREALISSVGLDASVAESVAAQIFGSLARRMHGAISVSETADGIESGANQVAGSYINNLKVDGCGNEQTALFQPDTRFTTLTEIQLITNCQTCNFSRLLSTTIYTSEKGKIIAWRLTGQSRESASDAINTSRWTATTSELPGLTAATVRLAFSNINANGEKPTPHISGTTSANGATRNGPSRFFYNVREAIDEADPLHYCAKASRRERDAGLEGMPERCDLSGGGGTAHPKADAYQARKSDRRNPHPTIKPLALARYLATLLLPPAEYAPRRIAVPFAGAGSECIGAMQAGWDEVVGVEMMNDAEHNYVDIARARVDYWQRKAEQAQPSLLQEAA